MLLYGTFLGSSGVDTAYSVAVDSVDNVYLAGYTTSFDFPTNNPLQARKVTPDAFITKLNPTGAVLLYSTYFGGSGDDRAYGIAVDGTGSAYVAGNTTSRDFPLQSPVRGSFTGASAGFVAKLDTAGTTLAYSTYLGGSGDSTAAGIAVDGTGAAYVAGWTTATDFPTASPLQGAVAGGADAFVTKLNPGGTLAYATYLGGSGRDQAASIAVDGAGNAYVAGWSDSPNFPTQNAFAPPTRAVPTPSSPSSPTAPPTRPTSRSR